MQNSIKRILNKSQHFVFLFNMFFVKFKFKAMIKQIFILILVISYLYSCNSNTENNKAVEENLSVNEADSIAVQEKVIVEEKPNISDYSDQNMEVSHYRNPIKLSSDESQKIFIFFKNNIGDQIPFEIAQLLNENELSEEKFEFEMPAYAKEIYHLEENALLFIRMFTGVGNRLTILCINNDMIVSKIDGITLDADSDGNYYISSKYNVSELGQIEIDITEEEYFLSESGINNFVIEYQESKVYSYELSADSNGIIAMNNKKENSSFKYSENMETLESWNKGDLRKLRNYIFAKHSYIFKSQDLSEYFKQFDWYEAKYVNVDDKLSAADKKFVGIVKNIEAGK